MKFICPLITVQDIARSRAFYEGLLGLKVKFDFGENVTFEGDVAIHLQEHFQGLIGQRPVAVKPNNAEWYFEDDDIDTLEKKLKVAGVEFIHPVLTHPWQQRAMRFYDPDGHIVEVGEPIDFTAYRLYREGHSALRIAELTGLPDAFIKKALEKYHHE